VKVAVIRGGGIAGIAMRTELSAMSLSPEDAQTLAGKLKNVDLLAASVRTSGRAQPDQMLYEFVVEEGNGEKRAQFTDENLPDAARDLLEWLDSQPECSHRPAT